MAESGVIHRSTGPSTATVIGPPTEARPTAAGRIDAIDSFRGIAILVIVIGHSYLTWTIDSLVERTIANLVSGGTVLFVFISGFLFHHRYAASFNYLAFLRNRASHVLVPYVAMSISGILAFLAITGEAPLNPAFVGLTLDGPLDHVKLSWILLLRGQVFPQYWYLPFIALMFLLGPLFVRVLRLPPAAQVAFTVGLLALSMIVHRPLNNWSPIHAVVYYLPVYLVGMICSRERARLFTLIEGRIIALAMIVTALAITQALWHGDVRVYAKADIFTFQGVDINIVQKLFLCLLLLAPFAPGKVGSSPRLRYLASISFAIYFIHPWVLTFLVEPFVLGHIEDLPGMVVVGAAALLTVSVSVLAAHAVKLCLGPRSRYLIGW